MYWWSSELSRQSLYLVSWSYLPFKDVLDSCSKLSSFLSRQLKRSFLVPNSCSHLWRLYFAIYSSKLYQMVAVIFQGCILTVEVIFLSRIYYQKLAAFFQGCILEVEAIYPSRMYWWSSDLSRQSLYLVNWSYLPSNDVKDSCKTFKVLSRQLKRSFKDVLDSCSDFSRLYLASWSDLPRLSPNRVWMYLIPWRPYPGCCRYHSAVSASPRPRRGWRRGWAARLRILARLHPSTIATLYLYFACSLWTY